MKDGKFSKRRRGVSSKALVLTLVVMLIVGCTVGGTLAWLTDSTAEVKNTFTTSDINITLEESKDLDLKMVPGDTITKDPKAKVETGSEECWLFVKIEKSSNFDSFMTYEVADDWEKGTGTGEGKNGVPEGVVFRKVTTTDINKEFAVLKGNQVSVKGDVTKTQMEGLTAENYPTLTFTAYASQLYKSAGVEFTAAEAWTVLNPTNP